MEDIKFNLDEIDKTFTSYKKDKVYKALIVLKNDDGAIVNIGGKNDAVILKDEFDNFSSVKIGDTYNVVMTNKKNDDNMYIVSKNQAEVLMSQNEILKSLKLGSIFSFVPISIKNNGLVSKLGGYEIFIPENEIDTYDTIYHKKYINKQFSGIVTEINNADKRIIASMKTLKEQKQKTAETNFWKSIFINKVVNGRVEKILPYGAFVNVDDISCFIHISDMSYGRIDNPNEILKEGEEREFRVIKLDREEKKVGLGIKQLEENPKLKELKKLHIGDELTGSVIKLLPFGVIIKINDFLEGLLHMNDATEDRTLPVHRLFRLGDSVSVVVKHIDMDEQKVGFTLIKEF